ncbi:hypothetical protein SAMN02745164_01697 [Marinitoga hydrogenitolerans DSM 16785]|uniref:Uncharacterized protein n=1 Tax=Marinitoga hydrogenitolerans (strain DSM 16785 / JCM 12826 / AT1271) TaxID=1122195 RepID=A0A1M4YJ39_MARH1|nr:hypothetical protein [Marinitoga hydrogenitolerans]SHF05865.1 hypothetical protein SAMN02745164_01697 [Marinitoga hydrogenitolerans DSM 16785]
MINFFDWIFSKNLNSKFYLIDKNKNIISNTPFKVILKSKDAKIYQNKIVKYINFDIYLHIYFYMNFKLENFSILILLNENHNFKPLIAYIDSTSDVVNNNLLKFGYLFIPYKLSRNTGNIELNIFVNGILTKNYNLDIFTGSYFKKFYYFPNIIDYKF